jgi:oxygen-independent coproporphyrinogen-3 oxidase
VVAGRDHLLERYLAALEAEIEMEPPWRPLDAVYVGGGTPTRVSAHRLGWILARLRDRFGLTAGAEVSVEANPEDFAPRVAEGLREAGFNRISLGAQSFDPAVLSDLGRSHSPAQIGGAVTASRSAGFETINLDLIFGSPAESERSWRATLQHALDLRPDHLSCYALTVERGTQLSRAVMRGAPAPDPDTQADRYETAAMTIEAGGLRRYEVSNFARPGRECRYNLSVWAQGEYVAFGLGAHGHRRGVRRRNVRRLERYLEMVEEGVRPEAGRETISGWEAEQERLLVGLRRVSGVRLGIGGEALLSSPAGRRLLAAGVISADDETLRVRRPLLTDEVSRAVLALAPPGM